MKKFLPAVALAAALAIIPATAVQAAPWDSNNIDFGLGSWEVTSDSFQLDDVSLVLPDTSERPTDLWDNVGTTTMNSTSVGLRDYPVRCPSDAAIDQSVEVASGDLVLSCSMADGGLDSVGLSVGAEIRVYADSSLVRFSVNLTNDTPSEMTFDSVNSLTNWGSSGDVYDYQNQVDSTLTVPATEDNNNAAALNSAGAQWIVHREALDAPGGIIIGGGDATAPASWIATAGDIYTSATGSFTIPAGETRYVVTFANWDPASLVSGDFSNDTSDLALLTTSADAIVASMSEFSELTGRLAVGLPVDATIVNWGPAFATDGGDGGTDGGTDGGAETPAVDTAAPELAATGVAGDTVLLATGSALAVLLFGAVLFAVTRRPARARR